MLSRSHTRRIAAAPSPSGCCWSPRFAHPRAADLHRRPSLSAAPPRRRAPAFLLSGSPSCSAAARRPPHVGLPQPATPPPASGDPPPPAVSGLHPSPTAGPPHRRSPTIHLWPLPFTPPFGAATRPHAAGFSRQQPPPPPCNRPPLQQPLTPASSHPFTPVASGRSPPPSPPGRWRLPAEQQPPPATAVLPNDSSRRTALPATGSSGFDGMFPSSVTAARLQQPSS